MTRIPLADALEYYFCEKERFRGGDTEWCTVAEVADNLGITRQRVHQIIKKRGIKKQRDIFKNRDVYPMKEFDR